MFHVFFDVESDSEIHFVRSALVFVLEGRLVFPKLGY